MFAGIGIWQLVIVLAIVILLFGGKRLRSLGGDIGTAIKDFKSAVDVNEITGKGKSKEVPELPR